MVAKKIKNRVILVAADAERRPIEHVEVSYDTYYGGGVPVVDSNAYRAENGIRLVIGEVYDSKGTLQQSFENQYSADGAYLGGRAIHADGTVVED